MEQNFGYMWDPEDFLPATEEEKDYPLPALPATSFSRDGIKRLTKNKVAVASMIVIGLVILSAIVLPALWPYGYSQMLGNTPGKPMDPSYNNLPPFAYSETELSRIAAGERVFPHLFGTDASGRDHAVCPHGSGYRSVPEPDHVRDKK